MRTRLGLSFLLLSGMVLYCQTPGDSPADRRAAAQRYAHVTNLKKVMDSTIAEVAKTLPPDQRDAFIAYMAKAFDADTLQKQVTDIMVRHFTTKELNALAAFYGSPEGVSITNKMPAYMADMMPVIQNGVVKAAAGYKPSQK